MAMFLTAGVAMTGAGSASPPSTVVTVLPNAPLSTWTGTSHNWAGYAIKTKNGSVTDVQGSWIEPTYHGTCGGTYNRSESVFWVGIDGFNGSPTVEQIGTSVECYSSGGTATIFYFAWYEFFPASLTVISSMTVSPGDHMTASVSYHRSVHNYYTLYIKDLTTSSAYSTSNSMIKAQRSSAEWVAESPASGGKLLPLSDFGSVTFTGCSATISGHTHSIGGFHNVRLMMTTAKGTTKKATTGTLLNSGKKFVVVWKNYGP
jgi:hypothetical protein